MLSAMSMWTFQIRVCQQHQQQRKPSSSYMRHLKCQPICFDFGVHSDSDWTQRVSVAGAAEETKNQLCDEAYPMQGGEGLFSYAANSIYQRRAAEPGIELVRMAIAEDLDTKIVSSSHNTFKIADLGCSVGPNTFFAAENILEAVEIKYQSRWMNSPDKIAEFQAFFNDHTANDFNLLFKSLPHNRQYYAAGVPGSFYGRLFPKDFIHVFYSSLAIQWLSRVPKSVLDRNSPAWNKGHIHFTNSSSDEVVKAFEAQYAEDMDCFLHARAQEIVRGGLMTLIIPGRHQGAPHSHYVGIANCQLLESCLVDMTRKGVVSEEKVDTFNVPMYAMSPDELEAAVERNGNFTLVKIKILPHVPPPDTISRSQLAVSTLRAGLGGLIKRQFGEEILDEFFHLYRKKLQEDPSLPAEGIVFLAVLKRNEN